MVNDFIKYALRSKEAVYITFCLSLVILSFTIEIGHIDFFKAYYPVGKWILETGTFPYSYGGMKNLPLVGWLLVPFALFEMTTARWIFLAFELVCYTAAFIVFCEYFAQTLKGRWIAFGLFITSRPFYIACFFGQLTFLAFLLFLLAVVFFLKEKQGIAGGLLTSVFLIKIPPVLLFLYFLRKKAYTMITTGVISYIAFVIASIVIFGWSLHVSWYWFVIKLNVGTTLPAYNNQTLSAVVYRFLHEFNSYDWYPAALHPLFHLGLLLIIGGSIIWFLVTMRPTFRNRDIIMLEISIMICLFLSAFPLVWDHYYMFLIFSYFTLVQQLLNRGTPLLWGLAAFSYLLSNPPVEIFFDPHTSWKLLDVTLMSSPFLGNVLLLLLLENMRKQSSAEISSTPEPILSPA